MSKAKPEKIPFLFTAVPDVIAQELDWLAASVFGKVWRFSLMRDKECWAAQGRIAEEINVSRATVHRRIKMLIKKGYLVDTTPKVVGSTHHYKSTEKIFALSRDMLRGYPTEPQSYVIEEQVVVAQSNTKRLSKETNKEISSFQEHSNFINAVEKINTISGNYPEDVAPIIEFFIDHWKIVPTPAQIPLWIKGARELNIACKPYDINSILKEVFNDYERGSNKYFVASPMSLVKICQSKVGSINRGDRNNQTVNPTLTIWDQK